MTNFTPILESTKQQLLSQLCEQFDDAIFILDANFRYLSVNATYELMIGYDEEFLRGRPLGVYDAKFLSDQEHAILKDIITGLDSDGFYEKSFTMATRYGQMLNCHMTYRKIFNNKVTYYIGMVRDISAKVADHEQLTHLLNYDQLTGLPNRKVFLSQATDLLLDSCEQVVIVRLNIDRYRILTNTLGQATVDGLIQSMVARVQALELENLVCFSHFGGDDFGLLFEFDNANMVRLQLDSLMQMCEQPFILTDFLDQTITNELSFNEGTRDTLVDDTQVYLHLSVGVSYSPDQDSQISGLINKAEKALNYAKQHGGDDICWYHQDLEQTTDSIKLEAELRQALIEGQFEPYYQPKVILDTGAIIGFEALVRWRHPTRGLLKPIDFIDAIIRYKLSFELFCEMSRQIAKQLNHWQTLGLTQHICINADAAEFNHPDFIASVSQFLKQYNIEPYQLQIEVTESSLMLRSAEVREQLIALRQLGICLALDDFGTGYASLSYLQEYPFNFIKIDKSFISKITDNKTQYAIVKAILDLAIALDMDAVAEGIETQKQCQLLEEMGCFYGQGYWFSHPVNAMSATNLLVEAIALK